MSLKLFPYNTGSASAKRLARALRILRVGHNYNAKRSDTIVNWGNSHPPHFRWMEQDLNKPQAIQIACNKLETFLQFRHNSFTDVPQWTTNPKEAQHWVDLGYTVYCRTSLTSYGGRGIVVVHDGGKVIPAPLYTEATKHKDEYRVHVFKGKAIDVQKKKRKLGGTSISNGVRNHANGWIYGRLDIDPPSELVDVSIKAVELLGLDFGAVDIGHRLRDNKFFVFEVNTAPGITGSTLTNYANAINNYYRSL